jgi:hypothetical protein
MSGAALTCATPDTYQPSGLAVLALTPVFLLSWCPAGWSCGEGDVEQRAAAAQGRGQDAGAMPVAPRCCCCCCCLNWVWSRSLLQQPLLLLVGEQPEFCA